MITLIALIRIDQLRGGCDFIYCNSFFLSDNLFDQSFAGAVCPGPDGLMISPAYDGRSGSEAGSLWTVTGQWTVDTTSACDCAYGNRQQCQHHEYVEDSTDSSLQA